MSRDRLVRWLRSASRLIQYVDQRDSWLLRAIPQRWKRRAVQRLFRPFAPTIAAHPVELNGCSMWVPPSQIRSLVVAGHEMETVHYLEHTLVPGMVVADIGANIGYFTLLCARLVGPAGRVYAIEPAADNYEYLSRNVELNGYRNVELHRVAAGASAGQRVFYFGSSSSLNGFYSTEMSNSMNVTALPLDGIVNTPVDLIKIDVEGAELEVLAGMERILSTSPQLQIVFEWNPRLQKRAGHEFFELPNWFLRRGFDIRVAAQGPTLNDETAVLDFYAANATRLATGRVDLLATRCT